MPARNRLLMGGWAYCEAGLCLAVLAFITGLIIGSFLNVLIYRIPRGESIVRPGSRCPQCGHSLGIMDLIPVAGYLINRARCRYCKAPISARYPAIEMLTGLLFVMVFWRFGLSVLSLAGALLSAVLIVSSFTDLDEGIIPNAVTYPAFLAALALSHFSPLGLGNALLGGLGFFAFMLAVAVISRGGLGGGDVKLAAVIGACTGPSGAFMVLILASLAGGLWGAILLVRGKAGRKTALKFGPFLAVAAFLVFMWKQEMLDCYLRLLM